MLTPALCAPRLPVRERLRMAGGTVRQAGPEHGPGAARSLLTGSRCSTGWVAGMDVLHPGRNMADGLQR